MTGSREPLAPAAKSAVTLGVLVVVLLVGLVWGWRSLTAALPAEDLGATNTGICTVRPFAAGDTISPGDVTVSVYNASGRSQLARATMNVLASRGFGAGDTGNAPEGAVVDRVEVWSTDPDSAAVALVRAQIGEPVPVKENRPVLGDGSSVVVVVGDAWDEPTGDAGAQITLETDQDVCGPAEAPLP